MATRLKALVVSPIGVWARPLSLAFPVGAGGRLLHAGTPVMRPLVSWKPHPNVYHITRETEGIRTP